MKQKLSVYILALVVMVLYLVGCADKTEQNNAGNSSEMKQQEPEQITLTIWDWDSAHLDHMTEWYTKKYPHVRFETLVVGVPDYLQKLQSALITGEGVPDILLGETEYRGMLFDLGITEDLSKSPYNLDLNEMFDFVIPLQSGPEGELYGVDQQICPSGFAYRRDLALQYLGTDDPDEIAELISSWDKMLEVSRKVQQESEGEVTTLPGVSVLLIDILYNQDAEPYINGNSIDLTSGYQEVLEIATQFNQAGVLGNQQAGTPALSAAIGAGEFIFFPMAPWGAKWSIEINDPNGSGRWGLTKSPGKGFTYGGTSISIYSGSEHKDEAWNYIREVYCDGAGVKEAFDKFGFLTGFKAPYEDSYFFDREGQYDAFFGGQNLAKYFIEEITVATKGKVIAKNENIVKAAIVTVASQMAANPAMTASEALESLKKEVLLLNPSAVVR